MSEAVEVSGREFKAAVMTLAKVLGTRGSRRLAEATLRMRDGSLSIEHPSASMNVAAKGAFQADLRVSLIYLKELADAAGHSDLVVLEFDGRFLKIGRLGVSAAAIPRSTTNRITMPLNASLADVLAIALSRSEEEIEESGLSQTIGAALTKRARILSSASKLLAPLGVTRASLSSFIEDQLRNGNSK